MSERKKMCSHLNSVHESFGANALQPFYNVISVIYNIYVRPFGFLPFFVPPLCILLNVSGC